MQMEWETNKNFRVILDNGSHHIRGGMANSNTPQLIYENLTALNRKSGALILGDQLDDIVIEREYTYTKPSVRGMVMNLDHELQIWDEMLKKVMKMDENSLSFGKLKEFMLMVTFPVFAPWKLREKMIEVMFEYYGFGGFYPVVGSEMIQSYAKQNLKNKIDPKFQLIVESGHSGTYIVPFFDGEIVNYGVRKIDIGGKIMTNYLKERISFRFLDVSHEYRMVNDIKEKMCYVSTDFQSDMNRKKKEFEKYYVLPDPEIKSKGYTLDTIDPNTIRNETICIDKERFRIPELLFNPSDLGMPECGLRDGIISSLKSMHSDLFEPMLENICVYGGNTLFPNFEERLNQEIRTVTPDYMEPKLHYFKNLDTVFQGCYHHLMDRDHVLKDIAVKKSTYEENGGLNLINMYLV